MDIMEATNNHVVVRLTSQELYEITICTDEIRVKWSENDIQTVLNCTGDDLERLVKAFEDARDQMKRDE